MKMRWDCVLERFPSGPVVGVEVGVWRGLMSRALSKRPELTLYLVDIVREAAIGPMPNFLLMPSVEAAKTFEDRFFDFVFIDADHSYEAVRDDIRAWLPKVKKGGLLCGHDFCLAFPGVMRAVHELSNQVEFDADKTWFFRV